MIKLALTKGIFYIGERNESSMAIAIVSTYPPNQCGIGEFASYLRQGLIELGEIHVPVIAVSDNYMTDYGDEVVHQIKSDNWSDYEKTLNYLNSDTINAVIIQHEFSIYGTIESNYINLFIQQIKKTVFITFHTILTDSIYNLSSIANHCDKVIALSDYGRHLLVTTHNIPAEKAVVIPNGVPEYPIQTKEELKEKFMISNKTTALTFGLLSPNKGIELVLHAIPKVIQRHPEFLYIILGTTHPKELISQGENYRNKLLNLVNQLKINNHVKFIPYYLSDREIMDYLVAADIYITPYYFLEQNSSATLTYAAYLGKTCISTPYYYAQELLSNGCGLLFPFNDILTLQNHLQRVLANPNFRISLGDAVKEKTKNYSWIKCAKKYLDLVNS
ncbi:glycosyltransferase [Bacillus sp. TL12]|uniref:glycosyltransferase n=1 Tax=Bacillus sp. TL12 TaxID=2894756 RepID=UPI001F51DD88|nr:glycosyltransferase [Bacillus sp. TL12]MCI0764726.1 glycosyltransferase [Bacillus sp. TL12]